MTPSDELDHIFQECSTYDAVELLQRERSFNPSRVSIMEQEYYNSNISADDFLANYAGTDLHEVAKAIIVISNYT